MDAEVAALRARTQESRYQGLRQFVSWLAANGPLRGGLSVEDAAAIVWTLAGPDAHRLLRAERGWTAERYAAWLEETLARTLL